MERSTLTGADGSSRRVRRGESGQRQQEHVHGEDTMEGKAGLPLKLSKKLPLKHLVSSIYLNINSLRTPLLTTLGIEFGECLRER